MDRTISMQPAPTRPVHPALLPVGLMVGALVVGVVLAAVGARLGPAWVVAVPAAAAIVPLCLRRPIWALALVFLAMPPGTASVPGMPIPLQVIDLTVLAAIVLVGLSRLSQGHPPLGWSRPIWIVTFLIAVTLLSAGGALDADRAFRQEVQLVVGFLLMLAIVAACETMADVRHLVTMLVAVGAGMSLYAFRAADELQSSFGGAVVKNRAESVFHQPNELGLFAAVLVLVAAGVWLAARTGPGQLGSGAALLAAIGALVLSLSRGAWLGTVLGAAGLMILVPAARRRAALAGVGILGLALAVGAVQSDSPQVEVVRQRLGTITSRVENPYDHRSEIWQEARREIAAEPWTGFGPGNFPEASQRPGSEAETVGAVHAHNALMTVAAEAGLVAAALLVAFTIAVALAVVRTVRRLRGLPDAAIVAGLGAGLLAVVGQGLVDYPLRNPVTMTLLWSVTGLVIAAELVTSGRRSAGRPA